MAAQTTTCKLTRLTKSVMKNIANGTSSGLSGTQCVPNGIPGAAKTPFPVLAGGVLSNETKIHIFIHVCRPIHYATSMQLKALCDVDSVMPPPVHNSAL